MLKNIEETLDECPMELPTKAGEIINIREIANIVNDVESHVKSKIEACIVKEKESKPKPPEPNERRGGTEGQPPEKYEHKIESVEDIIYREYHEEGMKTQEIALKNKVPISKVQEVINSQKDVNHETITKAEEADVPFLQ